MSVVLQLLAPNESIVIHLRTEVVSIIPAAMLRQLVLHAFMDTTFRQVFLLLRVHALLAQPLPTV